MLETSTADDGPRNQDEVLSMLQRHTARYRTLPNILPIFYGRNLFAFGVASWSESCPGNTAVLLPVQEVTGKGVVAKDEGVHAHPTKVPTYMTEMGCDNGLIRVGMLDSKRGASTVVGTVDDHSQLMLMISRWLCEDLRDICRDGLLVRMAKVTRNVEVAAVWVACFGFLFLQDESLLPRRASSAKHCSTTATPSAPF
jgi:hypothetical protein